MTKLVLNNLTSSYNSTKVNENFDKISQELQNKVLYRNNPAGETNTMESDVDFNSHDIYNVKDLYIHGKLVVGDIENAIIPFQTDVFSGNGAAVSFVLSDSAGDVNNIDLSVGGVTQVPGIHFSYDNPSKTITFLTGAPPSGSNNIAARYGQAVSSISTGYVPPTLGGATIANFALSSSIPNARYEILSTNPQGWNLTAGRKTVDFEFVSNSYFAANPGGHVSVVTRCNTDLIATQVSGLGAIMGDLTWTGFAGDEARFKPATIMETWDTARVAGNRYLYPETTSPRNKPLKDGVRYRWIIESTKSNSGSYYTRYRFYQWAGDTKSAWDLLVDTGDVLVGPIASDLSRHGLVFGHVFSDSLVPWSINYSNIKVTWGPVGEIVPDQSAQLSKYGPDVFGDVTFMALGGRVRFPSIPGPSLVDSLTFQSSTVNSATTAVFKPNGTGNISNILFSNNSSSATTYQAGSFGITGATVLVDTFGYSAGIPDFGINIGGNRVATFNATGVKILGASSFIGPTATEMAGVINSGGFYANKRSRGDLGAMNLEAFCTPGAIASYMSPSPTNTQVENVLLGAYTTISTLVSELRNKKII